MKTFSVALLVVSLPTACKVSPEQRTSVASAPPEKPAIHVAPVPPSNPTPVARENEAVSFDPVFFAYDSDVLTDDAVDSLHVVAQHLLDNAHIRLTIQGHTDSRGSIEYNFALGERRAQAIKRYLVYLGVDESQLDTLSLGESEPVVHGDSESAWAQNRRGEFTPFAKSTVAELDPSR